MFSAGNNTSSCNLNNRRHSLALVQLGVFDVCHAWLAWWLNHAMASPLQG
jgi:hypothetical protein